MSPFVLAALAVAVVGGFVALAYWRRWEWTGLPAAHSGGEDAAVERPAKTLWDWLQLLGIPVVLATLAFLLNDAQSDREQQREDQRAARQRTTAADAERENTLRTYLAQMSDLMLHERLLRSKPGADVRKVARTATLTAVRRLDGTRRGLVVQFLDQARLLVDRRGHAPTVYVGSADFGRANLPGAILLSTDLTEANLRGAALSGASISAASLREADLGRAYLVETNLVGTDLRGAYLGRAVLIKADLIGADFRKADLSGADLRGADLREADLRKANLSKANLSNTYRRKRDLRKTDLRKADLAGAILRGADLSDADLRKANLRKADLGGANIRGADFRGARGADLTNSEGKPAHGP